MHDDGGHVDDERLALIAKALAHPARVHIIRLLAKQQECRGAELFSDLPLAQSTISQHLRVLKQAGVVTSHAVGQGNVYCLDPRVMRSFGSEVLSIVERTPSCSLEAEEC
jgi:ArsR family transcriptional regulator